MKGEEYLGKVKYSLGHMKVLKIIILIGLVLGMALAGIILYPNYKKDVNAGKLNLVINYTNVTSSMKGKVIVEDGEVYLSKTDIENYYDKYIHHDEKYNYIIIAKNKQVLCFDINNQTLDVNGKKSSAKVIVDNGEYYIPMSKLEDVYCIDVKYNEKSKTVVIESLDRKLVTAKVNKNTSMRYKRTALSRNIKKLKSGESVAIVPEQSKLRGYTYVRSEDGKLGYIKSSYLSDEKVEREATVSEKPKEKISMVWEYFETSAPKKSDTEKYEGINVVVPTFLYMDGSDVKNRIDNNGLAYTKWAKSNDYKVWAMLSNNNHTEEQMNSFSAWINDFQKRKSVIDQIVNYAEQYGFDGINIDFENVYLKDKEGLSRFIIELKPELENKGIILSVDVTEPDGSDNWSLYFNRNLIGDIADYTVFMAYDQYGRTSTTAGPTAACYWVEKNINKFINQEEVDPNKIILGIPFYTILWKEYNGELTGTAIPQKNIKIPANVQTTWLEDSKQNYMEYTQNGASYKMWIEDVEATSQKLDFIKQYNLAGAAFWTKGFENPSVWSVVKQKVLE